MAQASWCTLNMTEFRDYVRKTNKKSCYLSFLSAPSPQPPASIITFRSACIYPGDLFITRIRKDRVTKKCDLTAISISFMKGCHKKG